MMRSVNICIVGLFLLQWSSAGCGGSPEKGNRDAAVDADSSTGTDADIDTDSDIDADSDGDADADADCDPDGACLAGEKECESHYDCAIESCGCRCPRLFPDSETTSYCYKSCGEDLPCGPDEACVLEAPAGHRGACLVSEYWEVEWKGKFVPEGVSPGNDDLISEQNVPFTIGSLSLVFDVSWIGPYKNEANEEMVALYYFAADILQHGIVISIPIDLYTPGMIDLDECDICAGYLVEYNHEYQDETRVLAVSLLPQTLSLGGNWLEIENAPTKRGEVANGSLKILFSKYEAKIDISVFP